MNDACRPHIWPIGGGKRGLFRTDQVDSLEAGSSPVGPALFLRHKAMRFGSTAGAALGQYFQHALHGRGLAAAWWARQQQGGHEEGPTLSS